MLITVSASEKRFLLVREKFLTAAERDYKSNENSKSFNLYFGGWLSFSRQSLDTMCTSLGHEILAVIE